MANAMLKHDEFPTSSSSVDWLSMCASNSDNSMNNMSVNNPTLVPMQPPPSLPQQSPQPPPPPPQGNTMKQSYEKMIGITSPITITTTSILHPSSTNFITTNTLHTNNSNSNNNQSSNSSNTLQQRKSVDFATLPPPSPKRIRQQIISLSMYANNNHPKWNTKQIVDALSTCITTQERFNVIQEARYSFNHEDQAIHNQEVLNDADKALTKHLTYLLYHYYYSCNDSANLSIDKEPNTSSDDANERSNNLQFEVSLTCDALEAMYRASSDVVGVSFRRLGLELVQLLITILQHELKQRQQSIESATQLSKRSKLSDGDQLLDNEEEKLDMDDIIYQSISRGGIVTIEGDLLLRKATKILAHYARVGEATKPMAHFPGLLDCLIKLVSTHPYELVPWEARLSALWILANLACNAENMSMMACTSDLVQSLVNVANRPLTPNDTLEMMMEKLRSRSIASRAILNLSWAAENKIRLAENTSLLDVMTTLCVLRLTPNEIGFARNSTTIQNIFDTTRRYAVGALRNIAAAPRHVKIALCNYRDGHILDVLTDAAWNDSDQHVKDRALATIHNLAVHDTASVIASRPPLVMLLKDVLLSSSSSSSDDVTNENNVGDSSKNEDQLHLSHDGTPKQHAHATMLVLERTITPDMTYYENIRDLLDAINRHNNEPTNTGITEV